ncbi:MAG: Lrp/AsnC family transcriptional regulator [Desulfurococcaceae archaeon]
MMLDEVDKIIINELMNNARKPFREIAKKAGISDVAVIKRVRKLEREGVIKKYVTIVDLKALGYEKASFTGINVKPEKLFDVAKILCEKEYIKYLAVTTGDHEILALILAKNAEELRRHHEEIKSIDGVVDVYPAILMEVLKEEIHI